MLVGIDEMEPPEVWYSVSSEIIDMSLEVPETLVLKWRDSIEMFLETQKEIEEALFEQCVL